MEIDAKTERFTGKRLRNGGRFRIKGGRKEASYYHVMSRTCGASVFFDETEKEAFRRLLWRMAEFLGVEVCTYCVMGNHFHILVRVPSKDLWLQRFSGAEGETRLMDHLRTFYSKNYVEELTRELDRLRKAERQVEADELIHQYLKRFCDVSVFCKELKERFSRWYNRRHDRHGTLWSERFRSVLVEEGIALSTIARYIDLNPVRAGMVSDPQAYRWSGYTEATSGSIRAIRGICRILGCAEDEWEKHGQKTYVGWLQGAGRKAEKPDTPSVEGESGPKSIQAKLAAGHKLNLHELVYCSIRQASAGLVLGSTEFVEKAFTVYRHHFGPKRKTGARYIREYVGKDLASLRDLTQKNQVAVSCPTTRMKKHEGLYP